MTKEDKEFVALPQYEQVSRGKELMGLLFQQQYPVACSKESSQKMVDAKLADVDWNVVVRSTFIEVVMPPSQKRCMKRSLSDSALPRFEKTIETPWKSLVEKLQDMSDASTNVSLEAEGDYDFDANLAANGEGSSTREDLSSSSDGETDMEALAPRTQTLRADALPYQYVEPFQWMPMGYGMGPPAMCDVTSTGFAQAPVAFDASAFMPIHWPEQSMSNMECQGLDVDGTGPEWKTTVMIRNMPNNYTREMLLNLVDSMGFAGTYDFAYLPVDFQSQAGLGYAFLNFISVAEALRCFSHFEGFSDWEVPSEKVCTVTWSQPTQGLEAHIDRYRNSPVMHHSLPFEWQPVLFQQGMRVPFPPPTKPIKTPKVRQHPANKGA
jgi:hypothetical protein